MVNVTHDGDNGWASFQICAFAFVFAKFKIESLQEFAVFVFWRHDLDHEIEFGTQQFKRGIVN